MNSKIHASALLVALAFCALLSGCGQGSGLSNTAKSAFFTDHRGFDPEIVNEDISRLSDALRTSTSDARLYVARGFIYSALNEFSKAIADFTAAEKLNPGVDTADPYAPSTNAVRYLLAVAHWQAGHRKEAIDYFSRVIAENPTHAKSLYYRGLVYWKSGDKTRALADIESAAKVGKERVYEETLAQMSGTSTSRESIYATYVLCFHSNKPPQSRPFGYVWEIRHPLD